MIQATDTGWKEMPTPATRVMDERGEVGTAVVVVETDTAAEAGSERPEAGTAPVWKEACRVANVATVGSQAW